MKTSRIRAACLAAGTAATLFAGQALPAHAQTAGCRFQLGFADLARLLGPRAGACREDQRVTPAGDGEQRTTLGLMVWRKADNWTAFTNGHRTWINGPHGLEERLNTERFAWEPDAGAPGTALVGAAAAVTEPEPLVPGTQLGLPVTGPTLRLTPTSVERLPAWRAGSRLLKVTVKLEPGSKRVGEYAYWDFRLRTPEGVEYRPSALEASRPGALGDGKVLGEQWVVGDLYFEVPDAQQGYGLHFYPRGITQPDIAVGRWIGTA